MNYFNEIDPYAAQWLRNLIDAGHIAPGVVDTRSIVDVTPGDLAGFRQCHFFAGVGVWSLALRRAGVPDDADVWTGSCPCQPFSAAGQGAGMDDERHLWPHFEHLIRQRRPAVVLGEQVASKDADPWIDLVQADLEALGYAFGAVAFPSASVGAPHIRDRLYWVADANRRIGREGRPHLRGRADRGYAQPRSGLGGGGLLDRVANAHLAQPGVTRNNGSEKSSGVQSGSDLNGCSTFGLERPGPTNSLWRDADWLLCRDGKWRPVEPGTFPLVDGVAGRVGRVRADQERIAENPKIPRKDRGSRQGRLRAYGNAINLEAARVFIESTMQP